MTNFFSHSKATFKNLYLLLLVFTAVFSHGQNISYSLTWYNLSGSYAGNSYTNETLTITIADVPLSSVIPYNSGPNRQVAILNGQNVRITLGSILNNVPLDNLASNSIGLLATANNIFIGSVSSSNYNSDRGSLGTFYPNPPASSKLTTSWSSNAGGAAIISVYNNLRFIINGHPLSIDANLLTTGVWGDPSAVIYPPQAPTNLVATSGNGQIEIAFTEGANGGEAISNYQYTLDGGTTWNTLNPADGTSPITIPGLDHGTTYTISLRAENGAGASAASPSVTATPDPIPNGPFCNTYTNRTTSNGLGNNIVDAIFVSGSTVYASTRGGLSISTDGGTTFTNRTTANGLGNIQVRDCYVLGSTIYAATGGGLSISTDGGTTFTNRTTADGLGGNILKGVFVVGSIVYANGNSGLSISTDGGTTFTNRTTTNGLGNNDVRRVYVVGNTVYAATAGGLSISTNGGNTFTTRTTTHGLVSNNVTGVFVQGSTVYAATINGLSISTNGGNTFTTRTTINGLGNDSVRWVYVLGSTVYAATSGGISISTDGGTTFTNSLASASVIGIYALGNTIYSGTLSGMAYCLVPTNPSAPTSLVATPGNGQLGISFTAGNNGGSAITNYEYTIDGGSTWTALSPADGTPPVTISGLTNGIEYILSLRAVNAVGTSASSASVIGTPATIPSAPTNLIATRGNGELSISFTPGNNGGSAITNYEYTTNGGTTWVTLNPVVTTSPVTIPGLNNGLAYTVALRAVNALGVSVSSATVNSTPPTITSFTPTSGAIGSPVVITGTDFTGATAVSFNGINSTSFTVNSATQITARVPAGATTGTIAVTTPSGTGTSSSSITIGGEVLLEYPFNNSLEPSIGTGSATITFPGTTTILGANSVCTDTDWNSIVSTAAIPLSSFNANAFQFDVDFSLPSLPSTTSFLLNSSNSGRDFGVKVSNLGRLSVFYRTTFLQDIDSQLTNVQLVPNTNYNLSVQFIANTIRMKLNGTLVLVVDVADGLSVPSNPSFMFGDASGARLPMSACIDNFRFIKDPLPFSFADQLVISPTAFSSFEACVNSPSVAQTFSVSGTNLSNNSVVITAPNRIYEISQNGTSFSTNPITLTASAGTLNPTTIHVRVISNPTAAVLSPTLDRILNIEVGSSNPLYRKSYILQGNVSALPTISGAQNMTVGGTTLQLTGSGTPDATIPWASSNPAVATISSTGEVTAVAGGTTTITYTVSNGCSATTTIKVIDCATPFGNALSFDGVNDFVVVDNVGTNSNFTFTGNASFTLESWVRRKNTGSIAMIFSKWHGGNAGNYWLGISGAGKPILSREVSPWTVEAPDVLPEDEWHHIAATYDGSQMKMYVDGILKNTVSAPGAVATTNVSTVKVHIGTGIHQTSPSVPIYLYKGDLDEIRVWNVARTATQIRQSLNNPLQGNESGLVGYYDFDQGVPSGTNTAINVAVNKVNSVSNGTLTNFDKTGTSSNFVASSSDVPISGATNICSNSSLQYTHPVEGGTWSISNGATATVSATGLLTTTTNENIILSYSYTLNGCPFTATQSISIGSPSSPTSLVATPGNGQLEISFTEGNNGGSAITNYEYTTNGGTTWTPLSPVDTTSPITIPGLTNGTAYTISLRAINAVCTGVASTSVTATPDVTVPSAPTSLVATAGDGEIAISFMPGSNGGSAITNYEYTINGGTTWTALNPTDAISPVTISGLTNGTAYTISLRAVNALGTSVASASVAATPVAVMNGPVCNTYTQRTTVNGLGNNSVASVYVIGSTIYAGTDSGLSISTDGGNTFTNVTMPRVSNVFAQGSTIYVTTFGGLYISTDGGNTFTSKTRSSTSNGLGSDLVRCVYAIGSTVYVGTNGGLSISTDGGNTFTNKTTLTASGLVNNQVRGVYVLGTTVYAATAGGLSISTDGGNTFTNRTTANGLGSNSLNAVFVQGSTVYAATQAGLSISTDGGATFTNKTRINNGLTDNWILGVYAIGNTVYAATDRSGSNISTNGGATFTNSTLNGLNSFPVNGVYALGDTVYFATGNGIFHCSANATPPSAPTSLVATPGNGQLGIGFTQGSNGGSAITNYEYTLNGGTTWTALSPADAISPITIPGLTNGLAYTVALRAVNADGVSPASASVTATPATVPSAPTSLIATAGNGQISVAFTAGADGGSAITNYEYTIDGGTTWTALNPADAISPVTIAGLTNGIQYSIQLRAINSAGFGATSSAVTATPASSTLAPPSISFASTIQTAVVNRAISITTNNSGGAATFTIAPALPTGVALNSSTGLISGTPTAIMASRSYTVTATNAAGSSSVTFTLFIDSDLDGDGIGDATDPDIDGDGVPNTVEIQEGTNPTDPTDYKDTDGDGVPDYVEVQQGTNPNDPNDARDTDGDGIPDYIEILQGTNPNAPGDQLIDTDGDGVPDYVEVQQGTNPNNPNDYRDTDGDGVPDYIEIRQGTNPNLPSDARDTDGDGTPDFIELQDGTDPNDPSDFKDDDGDGISNYEEGYNYQNPNQSIDTDGDGIADYRDSDSDGDTILDVNDAFPLDKNEWKDTDGDGRGDNADTDDDNDGILDVCDVDVNGDGIPDNGTDMDGDGIIDSCDPDRDGDGVNNTSDNCPDTPNRDQADRDRDGLGDVCDTIVLNAAQTFTPNGDGINDTWVIYNIENHPGSIVRVFNSNGKQVFYSANYKNDWNGNYQGSGEMLPVGSYLYQIDLDGDGSIDEQAWLYITK